LAAVSESAMAVIEAAPDAFVVVDASGSIVVVNSQAESMFGYSRGDMIGRPVEWLLPPRYSEAHVRNRRQFAADPHTRPMGVGLDLFGRREDGSEFPVEISLSPLIVADETLVVAAVRDVTEQRRSEQLFRGLLESAPDAIVIVEPEGTVTLINRQAELLFGYDRGEIVGQPVEMLVPGRFAEAHLGHRTAYASDPSPRSMGVGLSLYAVRKDGSEVPVEISLSPLQTETGLLISAAVRDVSERRRVERESALAKEEAERANNAKSDFLSRMSHELRTPLNAILGFGQLLEMERLTNRQGESLHQIMKAGRHLLELIDEVLDISRIESGRLSMSPEAVAIDQALSEAVQLVVPIARQRNIVFEERQTCAGQFILADRQRLRQVLLNLLSNAVKYNRIGGSVVVDCEQTTTETIRVSVHDTGPGIPDELIERIFMPFDRLGADESEIQGTGLGLPLSKGLVETMGGTIDVRSVVGEGSTFSFELPIAEGPESGVEEALNGRDLVGGTGREWSLLYIEDNLSNLKLIERVLEFRPNVKMLSAMQGNLGVELAQQHVPDMILLDLHLPDIQGEEVLARLRSDPATCEIPVAIVTADATPGQVQRLIASGAAAYLTKPLDVSEFLDFLDGVLNQAEF
jgi:PAS domain S-box-containing protein